MTRALSLVALLLLAACGMPVARPVHGERVTLRLPRGDVAGYVAQQRPLLVRAECEGAHGDCGSRVETTLDPHLIGRVRGGFAGDLSLYVVQPAYPQGSGRWHGTVVEVNHEANTITIDDMEAGEVTLDVNPAAWGEVDVQAGDEGVTLVDTSTPPDDTVDQAL